MPTYRSITTAIVTQHDIYNLPEYPPPDASDDPFSCLPTLIDEERALVSVYIPIFPGSQFWITYSISPPYPPKALYYFKLFLRNKCIVSWGCGSEHGYRGRTMFALYGSGESWMGESGVERRALCFNSNAKKGVVIHEDSNDVMEIQIFRARGRQRILPDLQDFRELVKVDNDPRARKAGGTGTVSLVKAGFLSEREPQRFYKYALIDPLDKPFATFHYYLRTWNQLRNIGVLSAPQSPEASIYAYEPAEGLMSPGDTNQAESPSQTVSSSSSSSNSQEHSFIRSKKHSKTSPPKWAIFAPRHSKSMSAKQSPNKTTESGFSAIPRKRIDTAVTVPSLVSLSPPNNSTVNRDNSESLVCGPGTPSPPRSSPVSQVPRPNPRSNSAKRFLTSAPPVRGSAVATRIPTPSSTKHDRLLGLSPTRNAPPPILPNANSSTLKLPRSRSGSMGTLMNAVSQGISAIDDDQTQRAQADKGKQSRIENASSSVSASLDNIGIEETPKVKDSISQGIFQESAGMKAARINEGFTRSLTEEDEGRAQTPSTQTSKSDSIRSTNDASSTKKKRWAMWGGTRQNKKD